MRMMCAPQVLPLFMDGTRLRTVGVLEVVQTVHDMLVAPVIATIAGILQVTRNRAMVHL